MIAGTSPGKRLLISSQRETLRISTPWRSEKISPASRSALKCWDSVDFGIGLSLTLRKFEQVRGELEADDIAEDRHPHRVRQRVQHASSGTSSIAGETAGS